MKKVIRSVVAVFCCLAMVTPIMAFASDDVNKQEPFLINTQEWGISGLSSINLKYASDTVQILPSSSEKIILKEYLTENKSNYYAKTNINESKLTIELGSRPTSSYASRIEVYIPTKYTGSINVLVTTGLIEIGNISSNLVTANSTNGLITISNYIGEVDCNSSTGIVTIENCKVKGKATTKSGDIYISLNDLNGNIEANSDTGSINFDIPVSINFIVNATTKTGWVTNNFSQDLFTTDKSISGSWGSKPVNTITLKTNSGLVELNKL